MALYDYSGALRLGKRQYQESVQKGEYPYLPVLDDILSYTDIVSEVSLGVMDIPLDKIIGIHNPILSFFSFSFCNNSANGTVISFYLFVFSQKLPSS